MTDYLMLFALVLGVNLLPAFGPPTWSIIVLFGLNSDMPLWATVPVCATQNDGSLLGSAAAG